MFCLFVCVGHNAKHVIVCLFVCSFICNGHEAKYVMVCLFVCLFVLITLRKHAYSNM